ncbi:hypothetical protein DFH09DRAFT_1270299 [Mycena vulgaris]|nr:hypothetical protein DFH09DRAFT_1270299 [Mycena vulgaris]
MSEGAEPSGIAAQTHLSSFQTHRVRNEPAADDLLKTIKNLSKQQFLGRALSSTSSCNSKCDLPVDPKNLERPLSQPEVVALIDFKVETQPDKTYKVGRQQQTSKGLTGVLGFISGHPVATATFTYGRSDQTTVDAADTKAIRMCHDGTEFHPLNVKVGMGINVHPSGLERPLPKISFINRNQILIRVVNLASKAEVRGIVVLISSSHDLVEEAADDAFPSKAIVQAPDPAQLRKLGAAPAVLRSSIPDPVVITSRLLSLA